MAFHASFICLFIIMVFSCCPRAICGHVFIIVKLYCTPYAVVVMLAEIVGQVFSLSNGSTSSSSFSSSSSLSCKSVFRMISISSDETTPPSATSSSRHTTFRTSLSASALALVGGQNHDCSGSEMSFTTSRL
uniref:Putative secreted protein n=1 Tax=Amblyomma tuberculatum TaxID=48802 RepID=A0A6M2E2L6_9ACAR